MRQWAGFIIFDITYASQHSAKPTTKGCPFKTINRVGTDDAMQIIVLAEDIHSSSSEISPQL